MTDTYLSAEKTVTASGRSPLGVAELISPTTIDTFFDEYWQRKPLVVHRDDPKYFAELLTLEDVDTILATSSLTDDTVRLVTEGEEMPVSELLPDSVEGKINGLEALYARYRDGSTINLMFLNDRWPSLSRLCQRLSTQLNAGLHANVYLTPPGSRGLTPHHDTHDVFVCQLYGTKNWTLHPTQTALPLRNQGYVLPPEGAGDPFMDFVMKPGDVAYLPRGTVHAAKANEVASLHLTIGVNPMVWAHAIRVAMDNVFESDVRFRTALPVGFMNDETLRDDAVQQLTELIDELGKAVSSQKTINEMASMMLQRRQPALLGHLLDLEALPDVGLGTKLRKRPRLKWMMTKDDAEVHLQFHGKSVDLPEYVEDEIAFMAKADVFTGHDIPGSLDDAGRLVLIQQLVREGFLTTS